MVSLLTPFAMASEWKILEQMRREPANVRFNDLFKVCEAHFGAARQSGTSHAIFKTPRQGDPRVNIQNDRGKAKAYQVRQVLDAIDRLKEQKS
ncbi:toxin HicA [Burkholderia sp. RS02]|uniref:toxin HicA n=1 Tax=unclassified Burkholderia TaxID=2613784 RepID=UPI0032183479